MKETKKQRAFAINRDERNKRRRALHRIEHTHSITHPGDGRKVESKRDFETSIAYAESYQIIVELAQAFISTIEFYEHWQAYANF